MSYILEALKKLEQKRQQEGTPNLLTLQGGAESARKKRTPWPYVVSGIVILNILLITIFFWVGPWKSTHQIPSAQTQMAQRSVPSPLASTLPEKKNEPIPEAKKDIPPPEKKDVVLPAPSQSPVLPSGKAVSEPVPSKAFPIETPPARKIPHEEHTALSKAVQPSKKIVTIKELPADIKGKLSELKMTVHSYNEQPQSRFAVINNTTVREGQPVNKDLQLELITRNGVVLNYQGHRFTLGINENP